MAIAFKTPVKTVTQMVNLTPSTVLARKVSKVPLDPKGRKANLVRLARKVNQVSRANKVYPDPLARQAPRDPVANVVLAVPLA